MDRGAWWATVHGVVKESDTTEQVNGDCFQNTHTPQLPPDQKFTFLFPTDAEIKQVNKT